MINKKAQASNMLLFIVIGLVVVFIFAIVAIPVAKVFDDISDEYVKEENFGSDNNTVDNVEQVQGLVTPVLDQLVFITLIAVVLGTFILALFSDFHPATLIIMILAVIIMVILAGLFANIYDDVKSQDQLEVKSQDFTFTNAIFGPQLPIIILIMGVISIIVMMGKRGRAGGA